MSLQSVLVSGAFERGFMRACRHLQARGVLRGARRAGRCLLERQGEEAAGVGAGGQAGEVLHARPAAGPHVILIRRSGRVNASIRDVCLRW